jgi:hypothetical protein
MAGGARPTLLNAALDLERIRLFPPFARDLLTYILSERERVGQISQAKLGQC